MSRFLGIGKTGRSVYKKLKQTPSDDDIESSDEENTVFDKNDKSTIELQLMPSVTEKRKRPKEEYDVKGKPATCYHCLLIFGVIVVALCGLSVGVALVKNMQPHTEPVKNTPVKVIFSQGKANQSQDAAESQEDGAQPVTGVIKPTHMEDINLSLEKAIKWKKSWNDVSAESCIRLLDVDGDNKDDILFGAAYGGDVRDIPKKNAGKYDDLQNFCLQLGESYPCLGFIIALRGYDGHLLWNLTVRSEVFLMNCEDFDIDLDDKPDCIGTGRQGVVVAFNPYSGTLYWSAEDDSYLRANWNTYQAVALPDWDGDDVPEVLIANGGDPDMRPEEHDREAGHLVVLSGKTGRMVGYRYLMMPNKRETYMTPVLYHPPWGSDIILFGSGGETISGDLMGISVTDMCHYIFGEIEAIANCSQREDTTFWPNLEKDENGLFVIVGGNKKGVMVPPVLIDIDGDSINDILVSVYEGRMVLKNGKDLTDIWSVTFPHMESYSTPAPGHFDDDDILDFMVHWSAGAWPWYNSSNVFVISGKDGSILWNLESSHYEMTSDLVLQTSEPNRDFFLFKIKGLGSPFRTNEKGEILRGNAVRGKRHGEEELPPQPDQVPKAFDESSMLKEYRMYHFTCDDDLSRQRGEMYIVDRSTMRNPLKILDIPLQKYWYDAPVIEPFREYMHDENGNLKNHSLPQSHFGVQLPAKPGTIKSATKFERKCTLLDSDDRSTGAVGDLDGDGSLEYISIYTLTGQLIDSRYSYYSMKYTVNVTAISLDNLSDQFKQISVPSRSSFMLKNPLKDIKDIHMLHYRDQRWTEYMGKHGDSRCHGQN